jgi:hypothetical protein
MSRYKEAGPMAPVTLERLLRELDTLKRETEAGRHKSNHYGVRLARIIRELRERGLDADRVAATAALAEALSRGIIPPPGATHLHNRLRLVA